MTKLQDRIRDADERKRAAEAYSPTRPEGSGGSFRRQAQIASLLVVLACVLGLVCFKVFQHERNRKFRANALSLISRLAYIDDLVLPQRRKLEERHVAKANDLAWFGFAAQPNGEPAAARPPSQRLPGATIASGTVGDLSPTAVARLDRELGELQRDFETQKKTHPKLYQPSKSSLRAIEDAIARHRVVLDLLSGRARAPADAGKSHDQLKLCNWRLAFHFRQVARERLRWERDPVM